MSRWADLSASALVGTVRAPVPQVLASGTSVDALLDQLSGQTPGSRLLASAALLTTWEQAGIRPLSVSTPRPEPAPPDARPQCPPAAAQHLARILQGDMGPVLHEYLEALSASGRSLPHRWLPELLDLACQKHDVQALVLPLLDERGRWLAAQRQEWQRLPTPVGPEAVTATWATGSRQIRLALLHDLRAIDPSQAVGVLAITWSEEAAQDRAAFIDILAGGLSLADEPFLESALDDRSKQVREAAARLLARLPDSGLVGRMRSRLQPLLSPGRRRPAQSLELSLPEACDEGMVHDGVEPKPLSGMGERVWWLMQMLAVVPPATWSHAWKRSPAELVILAGKTEHESVLLEGWTWAALRHSDGEWMSALLHRWADSAWSIVPARTVSVFAEKLSNLLQVVPLDGLNSWLADRVNAGRGALGENDRLLYLLSSHQRPWSKPLARAVLGGLRALAGSQDSKPLTWRWQSALPNLARYVPPDLAAEAEKGWPSARAWAQSIDRFVTILRFRQAFLQSLR